MHVRCFDQCTCVCTLPLAKKRVVLVGIVVIVLILVTCGAAVMDAYSRHFALHEVTTNGTASFHAIQQGASAAEGSAKAQEAAATLADLTFK